MKNNNTTALSKKELELVTKSTRHFDSLNKAVSRLKQFKVGDFLILHIKKYDGTLKPSTNSYGALNKFKVVHVSEGGMPFVKRVNKDGNLNKTVMSCTGQLLLDEDTILDPENYHHYNEWNIEPVELIFQLDPDYADALILQGAYDPGQLHRERKEAWKAITDHNKSLKVDTKSLNKVIAFFKSLKAGATFWTSSENYYCVQEITHVTKTQIKHAYRFHKSVHAYAATKGPYIPKLVVVDKKGNIKDMYPDSLFKKTIYSARPRSYKELNS